MTHNSEAIKKAFADQGAACARLGSRFMGRLMPLIGENLRPGAAVANRIIQWPGDISALGDVVPLRLAGALHALVLSGQAPELAAVYPPQDPPDEALIGAVLRAFDNHAPHILNWLDSPPQTNEVRRSAALIAAAAWVADRCPSPMVISELGASLGLNLQFDRFALEIGADTLGDPDSAVRLRPEWRGGLPPVCPIRVEARAGVDLNPLDPDDPEDALRVLSYLWPDQPERETLTRAAIALAHSRPERGDAAEWLEHRLATPRPGRLHVIFHTIAWQYFPQATAARCEAAITRAAAAATAEAPLAHISMEADGTLQSAALKARLWPHGEDRELARVDFRGRWIDWQAD